MRFVAGSRPIIVWTARLVGSVGAILALAVAFFMLFSPGEGPSPGIPVANVLCALLAMLGVLALESKPVLLALVLSGASFGSSVWGFGWYFSLALPFPLGLVVVGSLPYFVATVLMLVAAITKQLGEALTEPLRREVG